ncbi:MAG TPA: tol-pal system protein YbgF [Gammaproteobacteria bacterium]
MRSSYLILPFGIVSFAVLAGCSTITPTDDPVYLRLQALEERLGRIERVVNNESLIQMANQLEQLRADTQTLRGEVETLRFETESGAERQRQLYLDIDQRLQSLESQSRGGFDGGRPGVGANTAAGAGGFADAGPGTGGAAGARGGAAQVSGTDTENYQRAFELLEARRYGDAAQALRRFLEAFPDSALADNAQYWLAETYYVQRDFATALPEFQKVLDLYPQSDKLADSLLKVGYCNYELGRLDAARTALQQVMRNYPGTTAAELATSRLEALEREAG